MSDAELLRVWQSLSPIMPDHIDSRLNEIDEYGDIVSRNVLFLYRQCTCLMSIHNKMVQNQKDSLRELMDSVSVEPQEALRIFAPLEVQSISALINYLLTKPSVLAEAIVKVNHQTLDFWHLINITIPTVFSFFSSREVSGLAYNFYLSLSTIVPFNVYIGYVYPFFNTSALAPFSEVVFREFFWSNYLSVPAPLALAQKLIDIALNRIKFLPETHLGLLRVLSLTVTPEQIWTLLIADVLIPHLSFEQNVTPFLYTNEKLKSSLDGAVKILNKQVNGKGGELVLAPLNLKGSMVEVPDSFLPFGQAFYVDLIMTPLDIRNLVALGFDLPHHWKRLTYMANNPNLDRCAPFRVRVFPRLPKVPSCPQRPLIFHDLGDYKMPQSGVNAQLWSEVEKAASDLRVTPFDLLQKKPIRTGNHMLDLKLEATNLAELTHFGLQSTVAILTETASLFEQLMEHQMALSNLLKWEQVARDCIMTVSYEVAKRLGDTFCKRRPEKLFSTIWETIDELEGPLQVKYWSVMMILDRIEPVALRPHLKDIKGLEKRFLNMRENKENRIREGPTFESRAMSRCMWEAGGILSFANVSRNLLARCMILSIYLEEIQKLIVAAGWEDSREAIDNIIHFSLATSESTWVLRTVIFLQGTLYSDQRLVTFLTSQQAETWKKFTVAFIQFLSDDVDLLTAYGNLSTEVEWLPK